MDEWLMDQLAQQGLLQGPGVYPSSAGLLPHAQAPALLPGAGPVEVGMRDPTTGEPLVPSPMQQVGALQRAQMGGGPGAPQALPPLPTPPMRARPSFLRRFLGAAEGDPLDPAQAKEADKMAAIQSGLAMMAASRGAPGQGRPSIAQVILAGQQAGREGYANSLQRVQARRQQQTMATIGQQLGAGAGNPAQALAQLPQMTLRALAAGDMTTAGELAKLGQSFGVDLRSLVERAQNGEVQFIQNSDTGEVAVYDKGTGQLLRTDSPFTGGQSGAFTGQQRMNQMFNYVTAFNKQTQDLQATAVASSAVQASLDEARAKITAGQDAGPAGLSLVYALAQLYDPGSVVREGEIINIRNAASLPTQLRNYIARVNQGLFDRSMLSGIEDMAKRRVGVARTSYERQRAQYVRSANENGITGLDVLLNNPFAPGATPAPVAPPTVAPMTPTQADQFERDHQ